MARQVTHQSVVLGVPDLSVPRVGPHSEVSAVLGPGDRSDHIGIGHLTQLLHALILG